MLTIVSHSTSHSHLPLPSFPPQVTALQNESAREASRVQRKRFRDLAQMMASRVHHSKAYVAFYLVMAVLNTTLVLWIILSKHGHPHSIAFLGLELLITKVIMKCRKFLFVERFRKVPRTSVVRVPRGNAIVTEYTMIARQLLALPVPPGMK